MVRFFRPTHVASVALLLALPGWTTGAGELFKAVVGLASAADTNRLAQDLASAVGGNAAAATGAMMDGMLAEANAGVTATSASVGEAAMGNFVSGIDGTAWDWWCASSGQPADLPGSLDRSPFVVRYTCTDQQPIGRLGGRL